jgi:hypothetical protein
MPFIPNFPRALLDEHRIWHHANHVVPGRIPPPGFGDRFLRFHRDYINRATNWYRAQGYDPSLVAGWPQVPEVFRRTACYDPAAEQRVTFNPQSFRTLDELGSFIEVRLHGCFHEMAALLYNQPELNDFDYAPRHTEFYNIHGLIDQWYAGWERAWGLRMRKGKR